MILVVVASIVVAVVAVLKVVVSSNVTTRSGHCSRLSNGAKSSSMTFSGLESEKDEEFDDDDDDDDFWIHANWAGKNHCNMRRALMSLVWSMTVMILVLGLFFIALLKALVPD
jgi:hypothetical protein